MSLANVAKKKGKKARGGGGGCPLSKNADGELSNSLILGIYTK